MYSKAKDEATIFKKLTNLVQFTQIFQYFDYINNPSNRKKATSF